MKKMIALLLALVLILTCSMAVSAKALKITLTSPIQKEICTVSNEVVVKGCAPVGCTVSITLNDELAGEQKIGKTGVFVLVTKFKEGKNTLTITAADDQGNESTITSTHNFELKEIQVKNSAAEAEAEEEVGFMGRVVNAIKSIFTGD